MSVKVCFISHSSAKGGAERALPKLLEALQSKGLKVYVLLPAYGPMAEDLRDRNITFCVYPYRTWMRPHVSLWKRIRRTIFNFLLVVPIAVRIWRWRCDVVYTNTITVSVGAFAAKLIGRPHIWHIREFGYEDHGLDFDMGIGLSLCLVQRLSLLCITNSYAVAEKYKRFITPQKLKVIYEAYKNTNKNQKHLFEFNEKINKAMDIRCIIVGSLQHGKGQADAIMAVRELRRKGINAQLYIVGEGYQSYKKYLLSLVTQGELEDYVTILGYMDDPLPLMERCDLVLMCSRNEAFGLVTLEAMQVGKPVIGTRSGGTLELIQDGFNGLLYTPGDIEELSEKIIYLYDHPEIAQQMGKNGQKLASEKFNPDQYVEEILSIIKQLVGKF